MRGIMSLTSGLVLGTIAALQLITPAAASPPTVRETALPYLMHQVQYGGWRYERESRWERENSYRRYCARLRRACLYKYERGEAGEGNCRRYRRECER